MELKVVVVAFLLALNRGAAGQGDPFPSAEEMGETGPFPPEVYEEGIPFQGMRPGEVPLDYALLQGQDQFGPVYEEPMPYAGEPNGGFPVPGNADPPMGYPLPGPPPMGGGDPWLQANGGGPPLPPFAGPQLRGPPDFLGQPPPLPDQGWFNPEYPGQEWMPPADQIFPSSPCGGGGDGWVANQPPPLAPAPPAAMLPPPAYPLGPCGGNGNGGGGPVPFVPICDERVCAESCQSHLGLPAEGRCVADECYCKKREEEEQGGKWTYENQGAWPAEYPFCAPSPVRQQSPIDVAEARTRDLTGRIRLDNYARNVSLVQINTGRGVRLLVQHSGRQSPSLEVLADLQMDPLGSGAANTIKRGSYVLGAVDLHWGSSEHAVAGRRENAEMQLLHFDAYRGTLEDALAPGVGGEAEGSVLALAVRFTSDETKSDLSRTLFDSLRNITSPGDVGILLPPERYFSFLSESVGPVYGLYAGSLTYPPCLRTVNWAVANDVFSIRTQQIQKLQGLQDERGRPILDNARDLQEII